MHESMDGIAAAALCAAPCVVAVIMAVVAAVAFWVSGQNWDIEC